MKCHSFILKIWNILWFRCPQSCPRNPLGGYSSEPQVTSVCIAKCRLVRCHDVNWCHNLWRIASKIQGKLSISCSMYVHQLQVLSDHPIQSVTTQLVIQYYGLFLTYRCRCCCKSVAIVTLFITTVITFIYFLFGVSTAIVTRLRHYSVFNFTVKCDELECRFTTEGTNSACYVFSW